MHPEPPEPSRLTGGFVVPGHDVPVTDEILTNPRAERVKAVRALAGRSVRQRAGRFVVEGPQAVREAVLAADVHDVYVTEASAQRYQEIVGRRAEPGDPGARRDGRGARRDEPDGQQVVAVASLLEHTLESVLAGAPRLVAVLAHVRDPGQRRHGDPGGRRRRRRCRGAHRARASTCTTPRSSGRPPGRCSTCRWSPARTWRRRSSALRAAGLLVLAADGAGTFDLDDLLDVAGSAEDGVPDLSRPTAWVFGNEAWGLRDEDRALADAVVRVPIRGRAESLNLATAATVCLYASSRAQR